MAQELTKAFKEPSTVTKVMAPSLSFKVLGYLYTGLFKPPSVEEEMVKQFGNICPLAINPELRQVLETSFETSMASWLLRWHSMVLIS